MEVAGEFEPVLIGHFGFIASKLSKDVLLELEKRVDQIQAKGEGLTILLVGKRLFLFHFQDQIRPKTRSTLNRLKNELGMHLCIFSGDHYLAVEMVANALGIEDFFAQLRPADKLHRVSEIALKEGLIMVGDGVNDAPALARASVGISMGKVGSGAAIDVSNVVLLHDDLETLPWLLKKSYSTKRIVSQNVTLALCAIVVTSVSAVTGLIPLWLAVVLHEGGTVLVGLNSLRLLKI